MCDPVTMSTLAVVAGGVQAYSQIQQGQSASAAADYNARELENQATSIRNKGTEEENIKRRETAEFKARQRAMLGASGIDIDSGSAADLQQDTDLLGEVDALRIRRNFNERADVADTQAEITAAEGRAAKRASNLAAAGTILSTGASVGRVNPKWFSSSSAAVTG